MSGATGIQWTHVPGYRGAVWNPTTGCTRVSPGCDHCYAFALHDQRYAANKAVAEATGFTRSAVGERYIAEARKSGIKLPVKAPQYDIPFSQVQLLDEQRLTEPLRRRIPTAYFVDSMADLLHEDVPDGFLDRVFAVMALAQRHIFMVLTKRPERANTYIKTAADRVAAVILEHATEARRSPGHWVNRLYGEDWASGLRGGQTVLPAARRWPLPRVWLGVSVEDQERADERIPWLLDTPVAVRFLSCEPLLGPVDLGGLLTGDTPEGIDWVIAGGESGRHARPFDLAWARSLRDQCAAAGVPFFMKQLGRWIVADGDEGPLHLRSWLLEDGGRFVPPVIGPNTHRRPEQATAYSLSDRHGANPDEWPEDLRVREWPEAKP